MISFDDARNIISQQAVSFGTEKLSLLRGLGRVLAEDVFAFRDFPPFNRSAMDGIAINFEDLSKGITKFRLKEIIFAGSNNNFDLQVGECYKIMTGAAVPSGTNTVIRIEDVQELDGFFTLLKSDFKPFQNIATKGQDLEKGYLAIEKGCLINAAAIGFLASLGKAEVLVQRLPKVNIITTGNEVIELEQQPSDLQIFNSNLYALTALLRQNMIKVAKSKHVNDEQQAIKDAIFEYSACDILILTGGVSAGDTDYIPEVLQSLNAKKLFHKVAIKPGKPVWCGKLNQTMIFALPGNPFSVLVTFKLFVEAYIKKSIGVKTYQFDKFPMAFGREKSSSFDEFFPVINKSGMLQKVNINGSGDVRLGNQANALAWQKAANHKLLAGEPVKAMLLD